MVTQNLMGGGTYVVNLTRTELYGTTMTISLTGAASNPYDLKYGALGATSNNGTVVFTYAGYNRTVTIPKVGDPTIQ